MLVIVIDAFRPPLLLAINDLPLLKRINKASISTLPHITQSTYCWLSSEILNDIHPQPDRLLSSVSSERK